MNLKLGPHLLPGGEQDTLEWLRLRPAVAKFCYTFDAARAADPATLCLGRPDEQFIGQHPLLSGDPVALARQMMLEVYLPLIQAYPAIQVWEGPNEIGINPDQVAEMRWYSAFLAELGKQIHLMGRRAALGAWAVGCPDFSLWQYYAPVLQACRDFGAVLSRHAYGPLDQWYSYRHRLDEIEFRKLGFANTPVIISECGADGLGDCPAPWRPTYDGDLARYWGQYLKAFALEIEQDSYVLGATLFTVGTGFAKVWEPFDVASHPDAPSLPAVIAADPPRPPDPPPMTAISRPESGGWVLIFSDPTDKYPRTRRVTYDMHVSRKETDAAGVVWLKVNQAPEMWCLADQTRPKPA